MRKMIVMLIGLMMFNGCANQKIFRYVDEKADKALADKAKLEVKVEQLEQLDVIRVQDYEKAIKFIEDTRIGILKANFPQPYLKYLNTLAGWNFPIEVAVSDSATKAGKK